MNKNLDILKNINILYLEDDENLLKHTSDILEDFVANIYGVKNTIDAMKILLEKKVDVIISDILLENENGINFLKYIKSKDILIPAILTTAHTDTNYLIESIKLFFVAIVYCTFAKKNGYLKKFIKSINIAKLQPNSAPAWVEETKCEPPIAAVAIKIPGPNILYIFLIFLII